jgi:hypothetical protein
MSTSDDLKAVLTKLDDDVSAQVQGSLIASTEGFLITSTLLQGDAEQIAAMVATTTGVGRRMADTLDAGGLKETTISGEDRLILLYLVGSEGVLAVVAEAGANVALINMAARKAAETAGTMLDAVNA